MKARDIKGLRIVGLRQYRDQHSSNDWGWFVDAIICEDGTELRPLVCEMEHGASYGVQLVVVKPKKEQP